jgi:hypothetical protein
MPFTSEILDYIRTHSLCGIKAGTRRETFLDIWMVIVDDRVFARSWGFGEKSWYNTFIIEPAGQIRCGDTIVNITAHLPEHDPELDERISNAYLAKYNHGESAFYAQGIIRPEHVTKTMEFRMME